MPSIGETLRTARIQKGAPEETVAKVLKIKIERLKDLEENRFTQFAAPVYVRSFIRHYATYLGIDALNLVQQYEKEFPEPERKPIFDIKEDARTHTFVRHQPPAKAQGLALTSTGQAVLVAGLVSLMIASTAIWIVLKQSTPQNTWRPPENSSNQNAESSTPSPSITPPAISTNSTSTESWNLPPSSHLDTALTLTTNTTPVSLPGQAVTLP